MGTPEKQTSPSRRDFLRRTAAVAGAAVFPMITPGRALGLDGAVSAGNRITVGLIGMGRMMENHIGPFLNDPECQ
ncbi:MAG TPA: twin-arginine translocation signal domain-containing protein, partial [Candidatus Hydrogenedentes bacterium]|nr:twin-arginine translocation signal domain-containing protein [Candidatus Hydrogenedentota bacterium]